MSSTFGLTADAVSPDAVVTAGVSVLKGEEAVDTISSLSFVNISVS